VLLKDFWPGQGASTAVITARYGDAPSQSPCHPAFSALARLILLISQVLRGINSTRSSCRKTWSFVPGCRSSSFRML